MKEIIVVVSHKYLDTHAAFNMETGDNERTTGIIFEAYLYKAMERLGCTDKNFVNISIKDKEND